MAALVWLLIPLAAVVAAAVWARWAAHQRTTADGASLAGYERFRQAMQNPTPHTGHVQETGRGERSRAKNQARSETGSEARSEDASEPKVKIRSRIRAPKEPSRPGGAKGPRRPAAGKADRRARAAAAGAPVDGAAPAPAEGEGDSPRGPVAGPVP